MHAHICTAYRFELRRVTFHIWKFFDRFVKCNLFKASMMMMGIQFISYAIAKPNTVQGVSTPVKTEIDQNILYELIRNRAGKKHAGKILVKHVMDDNYQELRHETLSIHSNKTEHYFWFHKS